MNITLMQHTRCATVKKLEHRVQYDLSYLGVCIYGLQYQKILRSLIGLLKFGVLFTVAEGINNSIWKGIKLNPS